jgi:hypothetical protein
MGLPESKRAGIILGLGPGDHIVNWHNMGSAVVPPTTMAANPGGSARPTTPMMVKLLHAGALAPPPSD